MLLKILLLSLVFCLTYAGTDVKSSPQQGLENLVEKLESRLRDMETRFQDEKEKLESRLEEMEMDMKYEKEEQARQKREVEAKIDEMEGRLMEELKDKMKEEKDELEKKEMGLEVSTSKLEVQEESSRKKNTSNNALTNPSLRDLPIILISAYQPDRLTSPQTVTFKRFLANYNNAARPGGGDGVLDLDSGVFTCFTPGYYTVSFSAYGHVDKSQFLYLYKNDVQLPESLWYFGSFSGVLNANIAVTGSRIVVSNLLDMLHENCKM